MYRYVRYSNKRQRLKALSATYLANTLAKNEVGVIFIKLNMSWATVVLILGEGLTLAWTKLK